MREGTGENHEEHAGRRVGLKRWEAVQYLATLEERTAYLEACLAEDPGDGSLVRAALGDIAKAQGITEVARSTGLTREGLYKALSPEGNPEFGTIMKVIGALGFKLHAVPA